MKWIDVFPFPWSPAYARGVVAANGELVASTFPHRRGDDSASCEARGFIVIASNCHADFVEACELASSALARYRKQVAEFGCEPWIGVIVDDLINAALAKAKGGAA